MFNFFKKKNEKREDIVSPQYIEWRKMILGLPPQIELINIPDEVYGMLWEVGIEDGRGKFLAISIYALHTGEASLKASPGAGVIGLGNIESVSKIPIKILEVGQTLISHTKPAENLNYPEANRIKIFFLTTTGVKVYECALTDLNSDHPFNDILEMFNKLKLVADQHVRKLPSS